MTTKPNEIISSDALFIYRSECGPSWLHVIKCLFSGMCMLFPVANPSAAEAVKGLLRWTAIFGTPTMVLSDKGSEYLNRLTDLLSQHLGYNHHIATPSGCRSGIVATASSERLNRSIVRMMRCLVSAQQVDMKMWTQLVPQIQMYLNTCNKKDLGGASSLEVHTGQKTQPITSLVWFSQDPKIEDVECFQVKTESVKNHMDELVKSMESLHKRVSDLRTKRQ